MEKRGFSLTSEQFDEEVNVRMNSLNVSDDTNNNNINGKRKITFYEKRSMYNMDGTPEGRTASRSFKPNSESMGQNRGCWGCKKEGKGCLIY